MCHAQVNWQIQVAAVHFAWTLFSGLHVTGSFSFVTLQASAKMSPSSRPSLTLPSKIAPSPHLVTFYHIALPLSSHTLLQSTGIRYVYFFVCMLNVTCSASFGAKPQGQALWLAYHQGSMSICSMNGWINHQTYVVPKNTHLPLMSSEFKRNLNTGCAWTSCGQSGSPGRGRQSVGTQDFNTSYCPFLGQTPRPTSFHLWYLSSLSSAVNDNTNINFMMTNNKS